MSVYVVQGKGGRAWACLQARLRLCCSGIMCKPATIQMLVTFPEQHCGHGDWPSGVLAREAWSWVSWESQPCLISGICCHDLGSTGAFAVAHEAAQLVFFWFDKQRKTRDRSLIIHSVQSSSLVEGVPDTSSASYMQRDTCDWS